MPAAPAPADRVRSLLERFAFEANRTRRSPTPAAVHDLRVAIRRLDQALRVFKNDLPGKKVRRIHDRLKKVMSAAGDVRDYDIAETILFRRKGPPPDALRRKIRSGRKDAEQRALMALQGFRVSKWCEKLELSSLNQRQAPTSNWPAFALPRLARRFLTAGEAAATSGGNLHGFRILTKQLRYTLELFLPVHGSAVDDWMKETRALQTLLGAANDYRAVLSMAADLHLDEPTQAALRRAEKRRIRRFQEAWAARQSLESSFELLISELRNPRGGEPAVRKPVASSMGSERLAVAAHA
jgi:CHAD domain-containing protein